MFEASQWEKTDVDIIMSFWRNVIFLLLYFQNYREGLERWLHGQELWLFFQGHWIQAPEPTWLLTTVSDTSFRGSDPPLLNSAWCTDIHVHRTCFV